VIRCSQLLLLSLLAAGSASAQTIHAAPKLAHAAQKPLVADTDFSASIPKDELRHVLVGRSVFIKTAHRLTRVYVTNPAVLYAYTAGPNELLVTAKTSGVSSLVVWDEAGESQSYLYSSDLDTDSLQRSFKQSMPSEGVVVQSEEGRIILSGTVSTVAMSDAAFKLASLYSKDVSNALSVSSSRVKQVRLKVRIVEADRSKLDQFAFNFFSAGGNNLAGTTTTQIPSTLSVTSGGGSSSTGNSVGGNTVSISNPLNFLFYSSKFNIGATLADLESRNILQILAEPNITALSGEKAEFLAGGEFPFPVVQGSVGGLSSITIQFRPYGVRLSFLPVVNEDGTIQLKVAPEVSALDYANAVQISGYTIPAISTRRAETQVVLRSGQTFAISGLLDKRATDQFGRTPGIASIPVLGKLFKSKSVNRSTSELLVLVTPEVVDPMDNTLPPEPQQALPMLDKKGFDESLSKIKLTN
jgi:pilus assembly protein CpaC